MLSKLSVNALTRRFALSSVFLFLAACSTTPSQDATLHRVPAEREFDSTLLRPSHRRSCSLTIAREKGVPERGLNVFLDGEQIARMAPGEFIIVYVKPGRHDVGIRPLFSPRATRVCLLSQGESASLNILDRNGTDELESTEGTWLDAIERGVRLPPQ